MTVIKLFPVPMSQKSAAAPPLLIARSVHALPRKRCVESQVLTLVHYAEVVRRIVSGIAVDVVNILA